MSDQDKIYNLYESLNQSAIAVDQQRKDLYKYAPQQGKQSYLKYGVPTTDSVKVNGVGFVSNGISDEETIYVPGYAKMKPSQLKQSIQKYITEINDAFKRGNYGLISNRADILNLFSDTYDKYIKSIEK